MIKQSFETVFSLSLASNNKKEQHRTDKANSCHSMQDWIYSNGSYEGVEAKKLKNGGDTKICIRFSDTWKMGTKIKISLDAKTHISRISWAIE